MNQAPVLIVIPHYGSDEHLGRLFPTLGVELPPQESMQRESFVLPFANGSIYVRNNNIRNVGFTRACNEGIRYGLKNDFPFVWLLNNDTKIPDVDAALNAFSKEFEEHPETGVIGCKILSMSDPDFIHHAGTTVAFPAGVHKSGRVSSGDYVERTREKWVTGASVAISFRCLLETGLLDEHFFNYASDSDYCYRARLVGFYVIYLPVPILHTIGQSANPSASQLEILRKDMMYFRAKWITGELFRFLDSDLPSYFPTKVG